MTLAQSVREFIDRTGRRPSRRFGQNFLIDANVIPKIVSVSELGKNDVVIEIGAGLGFLTAEILKSAGKVIAIEIDPFLSGELERKFSHLDNFQLYQLDVLKFDFDNFLHKFPNQEIKVISNLPYNISTPIIWRLLQFSDRIDILVLMVQREVADRLVAKVGSKDYSSLTIGVNYRASVKRIFDLSPGQFYPLPQINSSVVRFDLHAKSPVAVENEELFFRIVRSAFQGRRKMFRNALRSAMKIEASRTKSILLELGIDGDCRGETLTIEEFAKISNLFLRDNAKNI